MLREKKKKKALSRPCCWRHMLLSCNRIRIRIRFDKRPANCSLWLLMWRVRVFILIKGLLCISPDHHIQSCSSALADTSGSCSVFYPATNKDKTIISKLEVVSWRTAGREKCYLLDFCVLFPGRIINNHKDIFCGSASRAH